MRQLREPAGPAIDIMIDFHGRTYLPAAIAYINAIADSTGERLTNRYQFLPIFERRAAHIIQPDLCHCGGLLEARKIAAMAEAHFIAVAPHNPLGPIANAAALHFYLATPNFIIQEDMLSDVPWRWEVVNSKLQSESGYWLVPDAPGFGVEVNEDLARKHPFVQEPLQSVVYAPDGAVLDR